MHRPKILVVDDSEVGRNLLSGQLLHLGFEVAAVESGHAAIEIVQKSVFDMILMDIFMPGIDGIETTARIRAMQRRKELRHFPIIAVTGGADRQSCIMGGLDDYVTKPILLDDLRRVVVRWLPTAFSKMEDCHNKAG